MTETTGTVAKILFRNCRYLVSKAAPAGGIIEDGAIYIDGPIIADIGKSAELEARYLDIPDLEVVDAQDKLVLPGLVDAHNHLGEAHTLLVESWLDTPIQGIVDAMDRIYWPAYSWLTEESAYDLTLFGLVNVLKHGATTHADAMIFPEAMARASMQARARTADPPQMISSVALPDARDEQEYLAHTETTIRSYHNQMDGLIRVGVHPNAIFNCSKNLLVKGMELARKYEVQFAVHIAESEDEKEREDALWGAEGGLVGHMQKLGLLGRQTLLFHGSLLNEAEIDLLAETDTALVHCPATNAWFGQCAYLPYMLDAGMRVGLGTDCVTHNLFSVMLSVLQHHNIMPRAATWDRSLENIRAGYSGRRARPGDGAADRLTGTGQTCRSDHHRSGAEYQPVSTECRIAFRPSGAQRSRQRGLRCNDRWRIHPQAGEVYLPG